MESTKVLGGHARIVKAEAGPALPLLVEEGDVVTYTGPLNVARIAVRRNRHLLELHKYGTYSAFLSTDPEGEDVREWACRYPDPVTALRVCLGGYFAGQGHTSESLHRHLRTIIESELNQLGEQPCSIAP